jgi:hypothetical protein
MQIVQNIYCVTIYVKVYQDWNRNDMVLPAFRVPTT